MNLHRVRSPALVDFWKNLKEVGIMMSMFIITEKNPRDRRTNESLSRASILLLCSNLEKFLESIIIDILKFHESSATPFDKLPTNLKVKQILQKGDTIDFNYSGDKWGVFQRIHLHPLIHAQGNCKDGIFDLSRHIDGFASPSPSNITDLFKGVGIPEIWEQIHKIGHVQVKKNLGTFMSRRNSIAHGNPADRPTKLDVYQKVIDVCQLVRYVNLVVVRYILKDFQPQSLWGKSFSDQELENIFDAVW